MLSKERAIPLRKGGSTFTGGLSANACLVPSRPEAELVLKEAKEQAKQRHC